MSQNITTPVCLEMIDKEVEEKCEDHVPDIECFQSSCKNVTRPVFMKSCREVLDEKCEVIIEQEIEEKCTKVEVKVLFLFFNQEAKPICNALAVHDNPDGDS